MGLLSAVADVLEKIAEEAVGASKQSAAADVAKQNAERIKSAADKVKAATGKEVSPETARKVAEDKELLDVVDKIAAERSKPTPMGGPAEEKTASTNARGEKQERLAGAFDSWGSAVSRNG